MDQLERFYEAVKRGQTVTLATAEDGRVTMRAVSPVYYHGDVLIFTTGGSQKYRQLKANPRCCIAIDGFYAEAEAVFCGATMRAENEPLRRAYEEKFPDAFDETVAFGGTDAEFVLLRPTQLTGWTFGEGEAQAAPFALAIPRG